MDYIIQELKVKSIYNIAEMPNMVDSSSDPARRFSQLKIGDKIHDTYSWNPLQIAVGYGSIEVADYLFKHIPNFHYLNSLSKPLSLE